LLVPFVAVGCYRPTDVTHCTISCDPLAANCPGSLVCGTDSFCHGPGERVDVCVPEVVDATRPHDAFVIPHDGFVPPDASDVTDAMADVCVHEWSADFSSDPLVGNLWTYAGPTGGFPTMQLVPANAPSYWDSQANESLIANAMGWPFATTTKVHVRMASAGTASEPGVAVQVNVNTANGKSAQITLGLTRDAAGAQTLVLADGTTELQRTPNLSSDFHTLDLVIGPNGGSIVLYVDHLQQAPAVTYPIELGSIIGGATVFSSGESFIDYVDICAQ